MRAADQNPSANFHGFFDSATRHWGDIMQISTDSQGKMAYYYKDAQISLDEDDAAYVVGKAMMIHASPESATMSATGARLACCNIVKTSNLKNVALWASWTDVFGDDLN